MRILVFHGYLLRGTGSNIYNANLARALAGLGHEVHLFCQDRDAAGFDWVDAVGTWEDGDLTVAATGSSDGPGSVTVYLPPIGKVLPVYVEDRYEGFEARAFPLLGDREIEDYVEANVEAVAEVVERTGEPEAALANHLVMGPVILARAGIPSFAVKNHGSDLEYTIRPNPRFVPWASEGLERASAILVGSRHTAESLWKTIPGIGLEAKTGLGPPGVDARSFHPVDRSQAGDLLDSLADRIADGNGGSGLGRDIPQASEAIRVLAGSKGPRVVFVGKLIVSKGVDLLAAAWPMVHRNHPGATLLFAGFGEFAEGLEALVERLSEGDLAGARAIAAEGRGLEGGMAGRLEMLDDFLADPPADYRDSARSSAGSILFSGRLEHDEVAELVPPTDSMVVPSTFPEAFGMVAAEAAASGVMPVCARHSGLEEVTATLSEDVPGAVPFLSFDLGPGAVPGIASRLDRWLETAGEERRALELALAASADHHWSWQGVARDVIRASAGEIRPLPPSGP